jgi:16S rRNA (uracil1498-N3)-methyltransferase
MSTTPTRPRPRFLAPDLDPTAAETRLPPDESRHLTRVLRLGPGSLVSVFDGRGLEFLARVVGGREGLVSLALVEPVEPVPEAPVPFTLIQAVLKGAAMDDIVRDATMMGAAAVQPVLTQYTAVKPALAMRRENAERWRRIAIASSKQSRRATLPELREPLPFATALAASAPAAVLMFVEPSAGRATTSMRAFVGTAPPQGAALVVGPEGGWADDELDLGERSGAAMVTLGHLTLRAEAVPMAAMAIFRMVWE